MKRRLIDRIHDRIWREVGEKFSCRPELRVENNTESGTSVSGNMPWSDICTAYAEGTIDSPNFRRAMAVRDIVETVGPVDGRYYASRINEWDAPWLKHDVIAKIDSWGDPIRWPALLLATPKRFSPTTLRYLATALWLKRNGYVNQDTDIVEIGVGFGGLAAMNALVSGATTTLVDMPQVEKAAMRMLSEVKLERRADTSELKSNTTGHFIISNYAFTELSSSLQDFYFNTHIRTSAHGIIVSNSGVFADSIRGRSDSELIQWFQSEGLNASIDTASELLAPGDHLCGVSLIHW